MRDGVSVPEAAKLLGISEGAVRQRIHRGTLASDKDAEGRVTVVISPEDRQNNSVVTDEKEAETALIDELRDRIRFLEEELADRKEEVRRRDEEAQRRDTILMTLAQRVPELEAAEPAPTGTPEPRESAVTATEGEGKDTVPPESKTRSWWRRLFS